MTKIAEIALEQYSAVASWSPIPSEPDIVALGSKESGGIGFDSTGGELRLYHFDYATSAAPTQLVCVQTEGRFASIDWSAPIANNKTTDGSEKVRIEYPLGLVAGGMEDGSTVIWNVSKLLAEGGPSDDAHVCTITSNELQGHRITALKFHPTEPWTLAIGCNSGSVVVADLSAASKANPAAEILDLATSANHAKHNGEVTALAWNSQVSHILASSSLDGSVGVWDLKTKKSWCKLQVEQGGVGCVAWNPKEGLYLVTASVDDRNPVMKVYDLGSSTSLPLTTLVGHGAGILNCSWCPHDETLLLSSSRDNRMLLWDLCTLQPVAELPPSDGEMQTHHHHHHSADPSQLFASSQTLQAQKHLRVSAVWSPCKRGLCLTTSLDRKVQVHSILALATRAGRPPKWIRPAGCCVSTFFGGGVVRTHTYGSAAPDPSQPDQPPSRLYHYVSVQTVPEQPSWIEQALQLEEELATTPIADFCARRKRLDPTNRLWGYLSVVVQPDSRERLLSHLGFDAEAIAQAAQTYHPDVPPGRASEGAENGLDKLSLDDSANGGQSRGSPAATAMSAAAQDLVKKSLIVGNFEAAVDCCYKSGNLADALLISYCGGAELWAQTQQRYLSSQQTERPYLSLLTGIVQSQWDTLVAECSTSKWQETLAILSCYAQSDEFPRLCIALGDRLSDAGIKESASLCYICALSVSHASRYWISQLQAANAKAGGALDWKALQELVTKVTVFLTAVSSPHDLPADLAELFSQYSQTLAEQGLLSLAARYCKGSSMESKVLRDRLYRSRSSQRCLAELGSPPEFPFSVESVAPQAQQLPSTSTSSRSSRAATRGQQQSRPTYASQQQQTAQSSYGASRQPTSAAVATSTPPAATSDALPPGWFALQDPASGLTYYANQTTGETTWERPTAGPGIVENMPNFATSDVTPVKDSGSVKSTTSSVSSASKLSTKASLVSKYGDGFVTSASHPELADQYGNIGTSNPYTGVSRPGTAAAVLSPNRATEQAPPSGPLDLHSLELEAHHAQIKDTLLALYDHLQSVSYPSEKRQLDEAKKGIDILIKNLSRNALEEDTESKVMTMVGAIANHDIRTAATIQTALVSTDWKAHKDWLKGIKVLLQLATKKL